LRSSGRLETERLVLRPLTIDDLDDIARFVADEETMRYIGTGGARTREQARTSLEWMIETLERQGFGHLAAVRKEDGVLVGRAGLNVWNPENWTITRLDEAEGPVEIEVAYLFGREHWGNGYATEAATAVRDWALVELGLERLIALIYPDNVRSIRVAEKLGMTPEGEADFGQGALTLFSLHA
jgi:[ribosomal protein S5]-alanine N-acetyltransferase